MLIFFFRFILGDRFRLALFLAVDWFPVLYWLLISLEYNLVVCNIFIFALSDIRRKYRLFSLVHGGNARRTTIADEHKPSIHRRNEVIWSSYRNIYICRVFRMTLQNNTRRIFCSIIWSREIFVRIIICICSGNKMLKNSW